MWWGGRAAEGGSLENCYAGNRIVSSNLTPTAGVYTRSRDSSPSMVCSKKIAVMAVFFLLLSWNNERYDHKR